MVLDTTIIYRIMILLLVRLQTKKKQTNLVIYSSSSEIRGLEFKLCEDEPYTGRALGLNNTDALPERINKFFFDLLCRRCRAWNWKDEFKLICNQSCTSSDFCSSTTLARESHNSCLIISYFSCSTNKDCLMSMPSLLDELCPCAETLSFSSMIVVAFGEVRMLLSGRGAVVCWCSSIFITALNVASSVEMLWVWSGFNEKKNV